MLLSSYWWVPMVLATLTLGLTVSYILDSIDFKPYALFSVWLSLIFTHIAFFFSPSPPLRARREVLLEGSKWGGLYLIFLYKNISKYFLFFSTLSSLCIPFFPLLLCRNYWPFNSKGQELLAFLGHGIWVSCIKNLLRFLAMLWL